MSSTLNSSRARKWGVVFGGRAALVAFTAVTLWGQMPQLPIKKDKEEKEPVTQTLQLPKELPAVVAGDTGKLTFYVSPLTSKGLLTQQIREAVKAIDRRSGSDTILKIRAFVAGTGDVRRVRELVSEIFTERRQPLPALTLVRCGGLPMEGAQVVLEAVASGKKDVNPAGLAFLSAQEQSGEDPIASPRPLAQRALENLSKSVKSAGAQPRDMLRVTCFLSSFEGLEAIRSQVAAEYPTAAANFVQTQRGPGRSLAACEGVARLRSKPAQPLTFVEGSAPGRPDAALVSAAQLVFTSAQISFGYEEPDAKLAFDRLRKALEQSGVTPQNVAFAGYYPLASSLASQVTRAGAEFFGTAHKPASTLLLFEGLPSMDAGFAVDVIAVKP